MTGPPGAAGISISTTDPGDNLAAYELGPTGAQFNPSAQLTLSYPATADPATGFDQLPMTIVGEADSYDLPGQHSVQIDHGTSSGTVTADLAHFSSAIFGYSPIEVYLDDPKDQVVGVLFFAIPNVGVQTTESERPSIFTLNNGSIVIPVASATVVNSATVAGGPSITPATTDVTPADGQVQNILKPFVQCAAVGSTWLEFSGKLTWSGQLLEFAKDSPGYKGYHQGEALATLVADRTVDVKNSIVNFSLKSKPFNCKAPAATPAPTPKITASPTPKVTPVPTPAADIWEEIIGDYEVTRAFHDNDCDYKSYTDEGEFRATEDGELWFDIISKAPYLSHMNYHGTWIADTANPGTLIVELKEVDPAYYDAFLNGTFDGTTFTGMEDITQNRQPCIGKTVTSTVTATHK